MKVNLGHGGSCITTHLRDTPGAAVEGGALASRRPPEKQGQAEKPAPQCNLA
jgi:hypothetical protein